MLHHKSILDVLSMQESLLVNRTVLESLEVYIPESVFDEILFKEVFDKVICEFFHDSCKSLITFVVYLAPLMQLFETVMVQSKQVVINIEKLVEDLSIFFFKERFLGFSVCNSLSWVLGFSTIKVTRVLDNNIQPLICFYLLHNMGKFTSSDCFDRFIVVSERNKERD